MGDTNAPRLAASEVALIPPVNGHTDAQSAIAAGGGGTTILAYSGNQFAQDTPTAATADGASHMVDPIIAAPPPWMDNAGHITAEGLYVCIYTLVKTANPTTPGLYIKFGGVFNADEVIAFDALVAMSSYLYTETQSLAAADLPYHASGAVIMPTDATGAVTALLAFGRLAA